MKYWFSVTILWIEAHSSLLRSHQARPVLWCKSADVSLSTGTVNQKWRVVKYYCCVFQLPGILLRTTMEVESNSWKFGQSRRHLNPMPVNPHWCSCLPNFSQFPNNDRDDFKSCTKLLEAIVQWRMAIDCVPNEWFILFMIMTGSGHGRSPYDDVSTLDSHNNKMTITSGDWTGSNLEWVSLLMKLAQN